MKGDIPTAAATGPEPVPDRQGTERALVFTDIVGSTKLRQVLGDREGTQRILQHHAEARAILREVGSGEEISTAGDGMFLCFESPASALRFALLLQKRLRGLWPAEPAPRRLRDRIGIHFGEVEIARSPDGTRDLWGLEVDRTSRVMSIATADQVLLSQAAFDQARQGWTESQAKGLAPLTWVSHGFQHLESLDQPQEIFEVGETGLALLKPPAAADPEMEATNITGWRPAFGEIVPSTTWQLEQRLGGGLSEEVWRVVERPSGTCSVLYFCFRFDRLERLRQRRHLFERLQGLVGAHSNLAHVRACAFDHPPFYVAYEHLPGRSMSQWLEQAGKDATPEVRLELVAQLADALEVAHRAGIIHGDLKPGAVLVADEGEAAPPRARLTRLGLGQVVADETLAAVKTLTRQLADAAAPSGPRLDGYFYLAPELLQGADPSPQSDLYALGVLLYQLVVGDFMRPVTADWSAQISDPLLREDLARCLAASPGHRLATVGELAVRLRKLGVRRLEVNDRERKAFLKGVLRTAAVAVGIVSVLAWQIGRAAQQTERARQEAAKAEYESQRAGASEREAEKRLVRIQVALGEAMQAQGDRFGAALYHSEALRLAAEANRGGPDDSGDQQIHRLRIAASLQQSPRLVQCWWFPTAVTKVIVRPGTDQILTAHREGSARLLDLESGRILQTFAHAGPVRDAAFLDGGQQLITVGDDRLIRWWSSDTGKPLREVILDEPVQKVAISPDGRWLAAVSRVRDRPAVHLMRADSEAQRGPALEHPGDIFDLGFSPDSTELATACEDGQVRRWTLGAEPRPMAALRHLGGDDNSVVGVEYSPDGTHLLTASHDGSAGLWDRASGRREGYFWHDTWLTGAKFSRDGARILTTSFDAAARVWSPVPSVATMTSVAPHSRSDAGFLLRLRHDHAVLDGAFSADQRRIATACFDRGAWLWNADTGDLIAQLKHGGFVASVLFHPDGRRVLSAASDGSLKLWDLAGMAAEQSIPAVAAIHAPETSVMRTPDGAQFLAAPAEGKVQLWHTDRWNPAGPAWLEPGGGRPIALDPSGHRVAMVRPDHSILVCRATDGQPVSEPRILPGGAEVMAAFFIEQSTDLLVVSQGPNSRFAWIPLEGSGDVRVGTGDLGPRPGIFISADGRTMITTASYADAMGVWRWDARSGRELGSVIRTTGSTVVGALSPRNEWLLVAPSDGSFNPLTALLVEVATGTQIELPHDDGVLGGTFSPDLHRFATASEDGTARLWELPTGRLERVLSHRHQVSALAFRSDGKLLATGSRDRTARVWDLSTGEAVTPPLQHPGAVSDLWFTPGGTHLATAWTTPSSERARSAVSRWPLIATRLSPEDVKMLTELLDCRTLRAPKPAIPLAEADVRRRWLDLSVRHPELFIVKPSQAAAWHSVEARACADSERWRAAAEHWNQVERRRPLDEGEAAERQRARNKMSGNANINNIPTSGF